MDLCSIRRALLAVVAVIAAAPAEAQLAQDRLERGFTTRIPATASGQELNAQEDLWVFEVELKPMRLIWVDHVDPKTGKTLTDPKTGEPKRELIWYLIYKAVNRDLGRPQDDSDTTPLNTEDPVPEAYFIPQFTLVTEDNGPPKTYTDVIAPAAEAAINQRERDERVQGNSLVKVGPYFKNSVSVVGPVPPAVKKGEPTENAIYGVAMWRGIDPETDYFTIYLNGFSNGYRRGTGPDGGTIIERKTIVLKYTRLGDRFFPNEKEIRLRDNQKDGPKWIYRADELKGPAAAEGNQNGANPGPSDAGQKAAP